MLKSENALRGDATALDPDRITDLNVLKPHLSPANGTHIVATTDHHHALNIWTGNVKTVHISLDMMR